jgi:hypothetical protein
MSSVSFHRENHLLLPNDVLLGKNRLWQLKNITTNIAYLFFFSITHQQPSNPDSEDDYNASYVIQK